MDAKRLKFEIANEQFLYWYMRMLKGMELMGLTDQFMAQVEYWADELAKMGAKPVASR